MISKLIFGSKYLYFLIFYLVSTSLDALIRDTPSKRLIQIIIFQAPSLTLPYLHIIQTLSCRF